jgi:hypothetical protein
VVPHGRIVIWQLAIILLAIVSLVEAPKMYKIGELTARPDLRRSSDEFVRARRELGYLRAKHSLREPGVWDHLHRYELDKIILGR